jgi:hypothetical protein
MFAYRRNPNKRLDVATDIVYGPQVSYEADRTSIPSRR